MSTSIAAIRSVTARGLVVPIARPVIYTLAGVVDPVQGWGGICTAGTTCGSNRNLLDYASAAWHRASAASV